jgi:hypothetical protein
MSCGRFRDSASPPRSGPEPHSQADRATHGPGRSALRLPLPAICCTTELPGIWPDRLRVRDEVHG